MEENQSVKEKFEEKKNGFITRVKEKANNAANWAMDHPVQTAVISSILAKLVRTGYSSYKTRQRDVRTYDPTIGSYYDLKRPLTNKEKLELSERHKSGESIGDILAGMRVLK